MKVSIGARLHCALVDLGRATQRLFGGAGLALSRPRCAVEWERRSRGGIRLDNEGGVDERCVQKLRLAIERLCGGRRPVHGRIIIRRVPPQHIGLGVTTAAILAVLYAINRSENLGLTPTDLQERSGRGGASGVGIRAFFEGGLLVDAGHRRTGATALLPSGASAARTHPLLTIRLPFPSDWRVRLLLPEGTRWSGGDEIAFFEAHTPIPKAEVLETLALIHHGLVPSIAEADLEGLREALYFLNCVGFKAREVASHGTTVRDLLDALHRLPRIAAGMSSMGPLVYAIGEESQLTSEAFDRALGPKVKDLGLSRVRWDGPCELGGEDAA